jgi:hypothetical protein
MARGFGALASAKEDINRRKEAGGSDFVRYFRLDPGETAVVRFLEQGDDVACGWVHMVKVPGRSYPLQVPCIDQDDEGRRNLGKDCPGCEKEIDLKFRGKINLIHRDAPIQEKVAPKRWETVGHDDAVVVWDASFEVLQDLQEKDVDYKGLMSRDFKVKRVGEGFDTKYFISPADPDGGPQEMSAADKELAEDRFDLTELTVPSSYDSWGVRVEKKDDVTPTRESPFKRRTQDSE